MPNPEDKYHIIADYYKVHYNEVKGFVSKRTHRSPLTEDITQDVFLRLLCSKKMVTPATLPCLTYTIAENLVVDYWRHRGKVEEYEHRLLRSADRKNTLDTAYVYGREELMGIFERGIARLDKDTRDIYRINMFDNVQVSGISKMLGISYKDAERRLGLARKKVRAYVARLLA